MSELISSRTWRAFSRAVVTQATTDSRFAGSKIKGFDQRGTVVGATGVRSLSAA